MNKFFIVSSVSASGKTTLVDHAIEKLNLYKLKTCTTRQKRKEEKGNEYYFLTKELFQFKIQNKEFIEWSVVYNRYYGLLKKEIEKNKNKNCIVILDVQGKEKFKKIYPEAITIFIDPPNKEEIFKRLAKRINFEYEDRDKFDDYNRIESIKNELSKMKEYDYKLRNDTLDVMKESFVKLLTNLLKI